MRKYRGFAAGLLAGCALMFAVPTMAATVKKYWLTEAAYPIVVNGSGYHDPTLPVLNYNGSTYVPLRAVGDLLGATVSWNAALGRVEISYGDGQPGNNAFRNVKVTGSGGTYTVTGEGRVFEATMNYAVEDGHDYLLEEFYTLSEGAPAWSKFSLEVVVPPKLVPRNGALTLELFEYSAKDGSRINVLSVPLETFSP